MPLELAQHEKKERWDQVVVESKQKENIHSIQKKLEKKKREKAIKFMNWKPLFFFLCA